MLFDNAIPFQDLPESEDHLKTLLNYNPQHNDYTKKQNIPERNPNETDRGGWRGYDRVYTKYLSDRKYNVKKLLEIGIYFGYGILTWCRYFENAKIYGMDNSIFVEQMIEIEKIKSGFTDFKRVEIFNADSTNENAWPFKESSLDVIIDDGDHHPLSQIKTLECGWKYLKSGGLYFIEDVSHRYGDEYIGMLNDKLVELSKENYVSIYSHKNAGLKRLNNKEWLKKNKIVNLNNPTEYIVVLQKL